MGTLAGHPCITRAEWGARAPGRYSSTGQLVEAQPLVRFNLPAHRCYVHHTATEQHGAQGVRDIQRFHQNSRGWKDIAYTYLVDDDGTIYEGRGHQYIGGHTAGENSTSHAICLLGDFDTRPPTPDAIEALADLARHGVNNRWWAPVFPGHRDSAGAQTACPGSYLYAWLPAVRAAIANPPVPPEDDPMALFDTEAEFETAVSDAVTNLFTTTGSPVRVAIFDLGIRAARYGKWFLAVPEGFQTGDPVYLTDLAVKYEMPQGGSLHTQWKSDLAGQGLGTGARVLPPAVIEAIPAGVGDPPVPDPAE